MQQLSYCSFSCSKKYTLIFFLYITTESSDLLKQSGIFHPLTTGEFKFLTMTSRSHRCSVAHQKDLAHRSPKKTSQEHLLHRPLPEFRTSRKKNHNKSRAFQLKGYRKVFPAFVILISCQSIREPFRKLVKILPLPFIARSPQHSPSPVSKLLRTQRSVTTSP